MNDETNQLLRAVLNRLDEFQAETKANFDRVEQQFAQVNENFAQVNENFAQVNQRFDRIEQASAQTNKRIELLEQRVAQLFERIKTLENQTISIGFELKQDIADLSDKIQRMQVDLYAGRTDAARAIVAIKDLEKRVAALEAAKQAA